MTREAFDELMKRIETDPDAWAQWAEENPEAARAVIELMPEMQLLPVQECEHYRWGKL